MIIMVMVRGQGMVGQLKGNPWRSYVAPDPLGRGDPRT